MDFLIATHNKKKQAEMQRVLEPLGINVKTAADLGIELSEVEENGTTFYENARIKALSGCKESGLPCIADDSGICVDFLDGGPGIYSARYSGGDDEDNNDKLLKELDGVETEKRTAHYACSISCCFPDGRELKAEGKCSNNQPASFAKRKLRLFCEAVFSCCITSMSLAIAAMSSKNTPISLEEQWISSNTARASGTLPAATSE